MNSQTVLRLVAVLLVVGGLTAVWWLVQPDDAAVPAPTVEPALEPEPEPEPALTTSVIGNSVEGREIAVTTFGTGDTHLLFVGGIHGGYEWNSSLLAYEMIDHFTVNPDLIPESLTVSIIPLLNPDGHHLVTGTEGRFTAADIPDPSTRVAAGRFNANNIDLNRNFACKWAPESTWRGVTRSAGTAAFSEPEAAALRDFVLQNNISAAVFWHSQANNVYGSECHEGVLPETLVLMTTYARAANYGEVPVFDAYPITGDAEGWLATLGIPAVTVELETHNSIEWERNLAGVEQVLTLYAASAE